MNFLEMMRLEAHGPDTFVAHGPDYPWGGLYGGQIVAQAVTTGDEDMAMPVGEWRDVDIEVALDSGASNHVWDAEDVPGTWCWSHREVAEAKTSSLGMALGFRTRVKCT